MGNKLHVLVVEDETALRNSLKTVLEIIGYKVTVASDGKEAKGHLLADTFDCVLSDINMPHVSGLALLKHIKEIRPQLPVILMTGFSVLEETKQADEMGASGFISKPFVKEDLIAALERLFPKPQKVEAPKPAPKPIEFAKINVDEFISGKSMKFDIFVKLSGEKYVKIASAGEDLSIDRIRTYKTKGLNFLYLRKEDYERYLEINVILAKTIVTADVSSEKRVHFLKHANDVVMEHLYFNDVDKQSFQNAKAVLDATMSVCSQRKESLELLEALNSHDNHLYAHSLGVSLYSVMIANAMGWESTITINKLALGGLFHDIGKKELDPALLNKPRKDFTSVEMKIYESHPVRGMEILASMPDIPEDILQIVLQHHEDCLGTGYPGRLSKLEIHPMAKVVAVADAFCTLAIRSAHSTRLDPVAAVKRLQTLKAVYLDPAALVALGRIFNVYSVKKAG